MDIVLPRATFALATSIVLLPAPALAQVDAGVRAPTRYEITIVQGATGARDGACTVRAIPAEGRGPGDALQLLVVDANAALSESADELMATIPPAAATLLRVAPLARMSREHVAGASLAGQAVLVRRGPDAANGRGGAPVCLVYLAPRGSPGLHERASAPASSDAAAALSELEVRRAFERLDQDARDALAVGRLGDWGAVRGHHSRRRVFRTVYTLYLLPSGRLAFPFTEQLTERDQVRFRQVKPRAAPSSLAVTFCGTPVFDRVLGTRPAGVGAAGFPLAHMDSLAGRRRENDDETLVGIDVPGAFSCADSIVFRVDVTLPRPDRDDRVLTSSTTTTLPGQNTYLFSWGGGYGYNGAQPRQITLEDRPNALGTATEKYLVSRRDPTGPGAFASLGYRPCGLQTHRVTSVLSESGRGLLCAALSPSFVVPLSRRHQEFAVGFPLLSAFGTELLAGVSLTQSEDLRENLNASVTDTARRVGVGRTYTLPGEPPVRRRWSNRGLGFYVGLTVSVPSVRDYFAGTAPATRAATTDQEVADEPQKPAGETAPGGGATPGADSTADSTRTPVADTTAPARVGQLSVRATALVHRPASSMVVYPAEMSSLI